MSFDSLLRHHLVTIRPDVSMTGPNIDEDEMGYAITGPQESDPWPGLMQPLTEREVLATTQAGAEVSDHKIFTRIRDLRLADAVRMDPDTGDRWQVQGIEDEGGQGHHWKVLVRKIGTGAVANAGS